MLQRYEFVGLHFATDATIATITELFDLQCGMQARVQLETTCEQYFVGQLIAVRTGPDGGAIEVMNPASDAVFSVALKQLMRVELQVQTER